MTQSVSALNTKLFKTPEGRTRVMQAYHAILQHWPVPFEEIEVETRFGMTHVVASGASDAPALILVHAFYATAMVWKTNVEAFSRNYRVYAVDCIGEPNPSNPIQPISSRLEFAQWWTDVLDYLKIDQTYMVGNSNGGFLTLNQVLHTPERIRKAVLISPAATFVQMWPFYFNFFTPVMIGWKPLIQRAMRWCQQDLPMDEDWDQLFLACLLEGRSQNRVFPAVFSDEELKRIQTPTLLLIGDHEMIYNPHKANERATHLVPNLCAEIIPNANHIAGVSNPDWINESNLKFIEN